MREPPPVPEKQITTCLHEQYGPVIDSLEFLPLGADQNTAVYHAASKNGADLFVKLRSGPFTPACVAVPDYLHQHGLETIIPILPTRRGELWTELPPYRVLVYSFIAGRNGFETPLTDEHWNTFGAALRVLHETEFPQKVTAGVPTETFSPRWRDTVRHFLDAIERLCWADPTASEMAGFLRSKKDITLALVERAMDLAARLRAAAPPHVLCHADIHAWNLLIDGGGRLFMVDWDTLIFAPRERDLMFIGGGLGGRTRSPDEEIALFYQGYGEWDVDPEALAYYRCERIIEDIGVTCEQIFLSDEGGADRPQALEYLKSNYGPGGLIDRVLETCVAD